VIRTLIAAASPVLRAGLEALLARSASVAIVATTSGEALADDIETHEPQVVPAFVQLLTAPTAVSFCARIASQIAPLLTLLHEQICAPSGSAPVPGSAPWSVLPCLCRGPGRWRMCWPT